MSQPDADIVNLQMTLLRKHLSRWHKDAKRPLTNFSSTSYGMSMVTQGHLAVACDQLSAALASPSINPQVKTTLERCYTNLSDALETSQDLSALLGELESVCSGEPR